VASWSVRAMSDCPSHRKVWRQHRKDLKDFNLYYVQFSSGHTCSRIRERCCCGNVDTLCRHGILLGATTSEQQHQAILGGTLSRYTLLSAYLSYFNSPEHCFWHNRHCFSRTSDLRVTVRPIGAASLASILWCFGQK